MRGSISSWNMRHRPRREFPSTVEWPTCFFHSLKTYESRLTVSWCMVPRLSENCTISVVYWAGIEFMETTFGMPDLLSVGLSNLLKRWIDILTGSSKRMNLQDVFRIHNLCCAGKTSRVMGVGPHWLGKSPKLISLNMIYTRGIIRKMFVCLG